MNNKKLYVLWYEVYESFIRIFKYIWLVKIKLNWNRLYIRKDEFHSSLDMDSDIMMCMNEKEKEEYIMDLIKRRNIAHNRDINSMENKKY